MNTKTAMITIAGRPNVGKSTLANALVGEKIAIVSHKPQTTRNRICAIVDRGDTQLVFIDTPGFHRPRTKLGDYMVNVVSQSVADVDAVILLVEPIANVGPQEQELIEKIKEARAQGDLSENAEYDAAKDEQRDIEARIEEIDKILKNAEVVVEEDVDVDAINIGCNVKIMDMEFEDVLEYKIVGSTEANSLKGKISNESPVGKALIGAKLGQVIDVETQAGVIRYKVLDIQRTN